jgi:hypothetical protein
LAQEKTNQQQNSIKVPEINPHIYAQLTFNINAKITQWREEEPFLNNGADTTGYPHAKKKNSLFPTSHYVYKLIKNGSKTQGVGLA